MFLYIFFFLIFYFLNYLYQLSFSNFSYFDKKYCPFIQNPLQCIFNSSDKISILYNFKYDIKNLYSFNNLKNCNFIYNNTKKEKTYKNYKIRHYILIRFYCDYMLPKEQLFEQNLLDIGIDVFINFTLKSLENQSNKNFEIIIILNDDIDIKHKSIQKLLKIKSNLFIKFLKKKEIKHYINLNSKNIDYLITTRIDHDDLIYNDAVKEIQNKCDKNIPLYYNGYDKIITMVGNDIENCYKFYPNYKGIGSISIFQSLIVNKIKINKLYTIYDLGNHSKQKMKFIDIYKENNLEFKEKYFNINHLEDSGVYVKHILNHSTLKFQKFRKNWHRSKIKIKRDKKWWEYRFGKFI